MGAFMVFLWLAAVSPGLGQYREYYIFGIVVDTQKLPLAGVEVTIREVSTNRSYTMKTKTNGEFKFAGLPRGAYKVVFKKEGLAAREDEWNFERPQTTMQKIEIPPVILTTREFALESQRMREAASGVKEATEKIRLGDYDNAISELEAILEKNPKDSNALYLMGMAYLKKKDWVAAIAPFLQVIELSPNFAAAHYHLGVCYQQHDEPEKALECYRKSAELDPGNPDNPYNSGLILFGLNRIDEAQAFFQKTLTLKPGDPASFEMAGRCYINQTNFAKAIEYLEKAKGGYAADKEKVRFLDDLIIKLKEQVKKRPFPGT
jgi:tetratricopeptide (TPR) repeat protein